MPLLESSFACIKIRHDLKTRLFVLVFIVFAGMFIGCMPGVPPSALVHPVFDSVYRNDRIRLKKLINDNPTFVNLECRVAKSRPLVYAARLGRFDIVKDLLELGADPNQIDYSGQSALHAASESGDSRIVKLLLSSGVNIELKDSWGRSALYIAVGRARSDVVRELLGHGAPVEGNSSLGGSCLEQAVFGGDKFILDALLSHRESSLEQEDIHGRTLLMYAACMGRKEIVETLMSNGADVNATDDEGNTPLFFASRFGHAGVAESLLIAGANLFEANRYGWLSMDGAILSGDIATIGVLMKYGAELPEMMNAESEGNS